LKYLNEGDGAKSLAKTLAVSAGLLCVLSVLVYYASVFVLTHSSFRFSRIAAGNVHVDILVAGNSRARDLLAGRDGDTAPSVFNLAYNALSREGSFEWIKTFFRQGNTANIIVIETSALYENTQSCDSKPYWALYPDLFAAQRAGCPQDARSARYFPLTMFNSEQYLRAIYHLAWKPHGDQNWGDDYTIPARLCAHLPLADIYAFRDEAARVDISVVRREIAALKQWLANNGYRTRMVFMMAPFFADAHALSAITEMERVNDSLLGAENNLSLARALGSDCADFADDEHIGPSGRRKLQALVFRELGFVAR
jgi:hypothetical protein